MSPNIRRAGIVSTNLIPTDDTARSHLESTNDAVPQIHSSFWLLRDSVGRWLHNRIKRSARRSHRPAQKLHEHGVRQLDPSLCQLRTLCGCASTDCGTYICRAQALDYRGCP